MPDATTRLLALEPYGIRLGLDTIRTLTDALDAPHRAFRSIIVAGTNGKGSVTAMVETALRAAGYRTARYTSPHLVDLTERFVVDGRPVTMSALREAAGLVLDHADRLVSDGRLPEPPTFFEATTAVAFHLFREAAVELAVLEVGMGGRCDATNIAGPMAGAITSIGLDHERFLGDTLEKIAFEKAGIIRSGMIVVAGEMDQAATAVIEGVAGERGARLICATDGITAGVDAHDGFVTLRLTTPRRAYDPVRLALRGRHQARNAVVAVRLLEALESRQVSVSPDAIGAALTGVRWPGRLDLIELPDRRRVLLDAAHNADGAAALAAYLQEWVPEGLPIVFAAMQDKDVEHMLAPLLPFMPVLICTQPRTARARAATDLAGVARRLSPALRVVVEPDPQRALERAWGLADLVCATGSIFLIGDMLASIDRGAARASPQTAPRVR